MSDTPKARPGNPGNPNRPVKKPRGNGTPPRVPRSPRASLAEVDQRVTYVMNLIIQGICRRRSIMQTIAKQYSEGKITWGVKLRGDEHSALDTNCVATRTVDLYMQRATDELIKIADEPRAVAKSKARARYELALAGAAGAKQWDTVRKVVRDMARLDGIEPGIRVNHGGVIETNHTGAVDHNHTVAVKNGSIDDRANRITDILGIAADRKRAQLATAQEQAANN